jgi:hypothetical protein
VDPSPLLQITIHRRDIADVVLRDDRVRGNYRDAIRPIAVLKPTKQQALKTKSGLDRERVTNQVARTRLTAGEREEIGANEEHDGAARTVRCSHPKPSA